MTFWAVVKPIVFKSKLVRLLFWATFGKTWVTFYFNIWSQWWVSWFLLKNGPTPVLIFVLWMICTINHALPRLSVSSKQNSPSFKSWSPRLNGTCNSFKWRLKIPHRWVWRYYFKLCLSHLRNLCIRCTSISSIAHWSRSRAISFWLEWGSATANGSWMLVSAQKWVILLMKTRPYTIESMR